MKSCYWPEQRIVNRVYIARTCRGSNEGKTGVDVKGNRTSEKDDTNQLNNDCRSILPLWSVQGKRRAAAIRKIGVWKTNIRLRQ
ncbi:unnamed protein product [Cylicocyclus nassatus]|uniref:Uncharacterized protein n=1 Tax=Cylicocyclus nassatus TaxID=53992 RepID=A0AA36GJX9_CYLNA|nr:unnamed protein product [Cylicocyclus nassatus]